MRRREEDNFWQVIVASALLLAFAAIPMVTMAGKSEPGGTYTCSQTKIEFLGDVPFMVCSKYSR